MEYPIRILHENVELNPGGIESLLMNLYRNIDRDKVQFDFLLHRPYEGAYEKEVLELGGKIYKTPPFNPFHFKEYKNGIVDVFKTHPEYKILHAHSELDLWPLREAKKIGIPVRIAHSHNAKTTINLKYAFFLYEKMFIKNNCTDMFMCSSLAGNWTYGKKAVNSGKCVFIKNGIDVKDYVYDQSIRNSVRNELGVENNFVVGHVGRYMKQKNHDFLIEIFSEIVKKIPNARLISIGDGILIDKIKEKSKKLGIYDKIMFLGHRSDVSRILQAMDVFLFPSLWEGLPLTCVEAQSAGLPIVMSDVITNEVCLTDLVETVSLHDSASHWAEVVIKKSVDFTRKDVSQQVIDSGFDIKTTAKYLENFYLQKSREIDSNGRTC